MRQQLFFYLLAISLLLAYPVSGQETDSVVYYSSFPDSFHAKVLTQFQPVTFRLREEGRDPQLVYQPNAGPRLGVGAYIVDIHVVASFKLPDAFIRDPEVYGETDYHDFHINMNGKELVLSFDYQYREGLHLAATRNLPGLPGGDVLLRPRLRLESYGLHGAYVFSPDKLSYRSIIIQSERQQKSAGSFLLMGNAKYLRLSGGSRLFPSEFRQYFNEPLRLQEGNFSSLAVMPGYSYTLVLSDFYLNFGLALGPDLQYQEVREEGSMEKESSWRLEPMVNLRGGVGYDNGQFFSGIYFKAWQSRYQVGAIRMLHDQGFVRLVVGHRFPETGWMKDIREMKVYRWAMDLFNRGS